MKLSKEKLLTLLDSPRDYDSNNIQAICPWCGKNEFFISINDNHPFQCWRKSKCGESGSIYKLLEKLGRFDIYNIKEDVQWVNKVDTQLINKQDEQVDLELPEVKLPIGFRRIYDDTYLNERGFKKHDYNDYVIGYSKLASGLFDYVIFAIQQDHKTVAYISRRRDLKSRAGVYLQTGLRYINSVSEFSKILLGYDDLTEETETVIIVEGLFDRKNINDILDLKNKKEIKCCATFKCHVSTEQRIRLLNKGIKNLIILYDPDVLNQIRLESIELAKYFNVKIGLIEAKKENGEVKDAAELTLSEMIHVLDNLYLPLDFFLRKVQIMDFK